MIKGTILILALVAGLAAVACAQEKTQQYFDRLLYDLGSKGFDSNDAFFARQLGSKLYQSCDGKDRKAFANELADESSDAYRCATRQLAEPEALISILGFAPLRPSKESSITYLNRIRNHMFNKVNLLNIEDLVLDAKRACQSYVAGIVPYFLEADATTEFINSASYGYEISARNACQVLLKNDISKGVIAKVGKHANKKYAEEKKLLENKYRNDKYIKNLSLIHVH